MAAALGIARQASRGRASSTDRADSLCYWGCSAWVYAYDDDLADAGEFVIGHGAVDGGDGDHHIDKRRVMVR